MKLKYILYSVLNIFIRVTLLLFLFNILLIWISCDIHVMAFFLVNHVDVDISCITKGREVSVQRRSGGGGGGVGGVFWLEWGRLGT